MNYCLLLNNIFSPQVEFDEGRLKDDPIRAKEEVEENLAMLESDDIINREEKPLLFLFQEIWLAFKKVGSSYK